MKRKFWVLITVPQEQPGNSRLIYISVSLNFFFLKTGIEFQVISVMKTATFKCVKIIGAYYLLVTAISHSSFKSENGHLRHLL